MKELIYRENKCKSLIKLMDSHKSKEALLTIQKQLFKEHLKIIPLYQLQ